MLPPAISSAIDGLGSPRAASALDSALGATVRSVWPEVAWQASLLTPGGSPVEFNFSTASPSVARYVVQVAPPESPPASRLAATVAYLGGLGVLVPASPLLQLIREEQATAVTRWGCWLGGRHGAADDRYKLYVEVPATRAAIVDARTSAMDLTPAGILGGVGELRLFGIDADGDSVERYYSIHPLPVDLLAAVMADAGLGDRLEALLDLVREATGRPVTDRLPAGVVGVSRRGTTGDGVVSVIASANAWLGPDAACRSRLIGLVDRRGWSLGAYAAVTRPLVDTRRWERHHTMVTFSVGVRGDLSVGIGVRAPETTRGST
jgi:hypothetical protein